MNKKISKQYTASTLTTYNDMLGVILKNNYPVNMTANREALVIVLDFDDNDASTINQITEAVKDMEIIVSDTITIDALGASVIAEIAHAKSTITKAAENISDLHKKNEWLTNDRDMYQKWFREASNKNDRVKSQVKAIAVLINSIFPE